MKKVRFIFNADDFGRSPDENRGIRAALAGGLVHSVTVMANFKEAEEIVRLKREAPSLGVGVHINLTEGRPVLSLEKVASLVDSGGGFFPKHLLLAKLLTGRVSLQQIENEIKAQIDRIRHLTGEITHADSHQNVHIMPGIITAVANACRAYGIKKIRSQYEVRLSALNQLIPQKILAQIAFKAIIFVKTFCQNKLERLGLSSPAALLAGIPGYMEESNNWRATLKWWNQGLTLLPEATYEICLHPGVSPAQVALMTSEEFKTILARLKYKSITYADV